MNYPLMEIGIPAGKTIGSILNKLLDEVMGETIENEKEKLLKRVKEILSHE